jgi:hypothetical protein
MTGSQSSAKKAGCIGLTGCLALLGGAIVFGGLIALIIYFVIGTFKSSPVYTQAIKAAQSDARVTQALGEPIQPGWFVTGSIEEQGISGDATLTIPISGPRKSGTLFASARKSNGTWEFYTLAVQIDGDDKVIPLNPPR